MKPALAVLAERVGQFAGSGSCFSFDPAWGEIAGGAGFLLVALREAALSPAADAPALLSDCIAMLDQPAAREKIDAYYLTVLRAATPDKEQHALAQSARIQRNATGLLRAARAVVSQPSGWIPASAAERVWAGWLARESQAPVAMRVPIAGHCGGAGFLAEIQLSPIAAASPPVAVEHPELALEPLGARLMEAVGEQARSQGISFLWHITIKDDLGGQLAPLDGDSLGAALAAGVELMSRRLTYHPGCLLIGRLLDEPSPPPDAGNRRLGRTGYEREKILRARDGGFTRIGVAPDSEIGDAEMERLKPMTIKRLRTVRDAVDFAVARKPIPYL